MIFRLGSRYISGIFLLEHHVPCLQQLNFLLKILFRDLVVCFSVSHTRVDSNVEQ